ncbi:Phosphoribosylformylglycinamidine synthase [Trinorchestia longiramus]|nr:Phosphoribosylformylglycinamidine synthase [Trinorchestia longiramus]
MYPTRSSELDAGATTMEAVLSKLEDTKNLEVEADSPVLRWFGIADACEETKEKLGSFVSEVRKQPCYYIQLKQKDRFHTCPVRNRQLEGKKVLLQLLGDGAVYSRGSAEASEHTDENGFIVQPFQPQQQFIVEIGPKLRHRTPWCVNVLSICHAAELPVQRIERTYRYLVTVASEGEDMEEAKKKAIEVLHDPVLEEVYETPLTSFHDEEVKKEYLWVEIPLLTTGKSLLKETSDKHALGFDEADIDFYFNLYTKQLKRNPTIPELMDLAQSNSEHSRHWFFKGKYYLDGKPLEKSLMDMVIETNGETTNQNNVIKFHDNSSAITGFNVTSVKPSDPRKLSLFQCVDSMKHLLLTAETHNFPTGVAPFSGSATGVGGRIRDVMAAGRGGYVLTATAGYCVGQLNFPDAELPWETKKDHVGYFESALKIIIEASNGASDYGNKFGEPLISGFFRAFGGALGSEWREWLKPIMFSAGVGVIDHNHVDKQSSAKDAKPLQIGKIGGPAYRIGIGGGAASSVEVQGASGSRTKNAVQRGDPEMGNKLNRFVRACIELGDKNPILSIHDQGAGGNANVLKEIVDGQGADIYSRAFTVGDSTLSLEELWCAEYQESNAILFDHVGQSSLRQIAEREKCELDVVGVLRTDKKFHLHPTLCYETTGSDTIPVDFPLDVVMEGLPRKSYNWTSEREESAPLKLAASVKAEEAMDRVLRLPSVASKRFLTSKVDRSVTGLVAQQQCVGEHQLPLADVAVTACSYFSHEGIATTTGEQPIITTVNPAAGARMSLMEALVSIVMAPICALKDVKCSVNWMWPAKLKGEGASMYEACAGLCELMKTIGVGIDGGKDSLGMAAQTLNSNGQPKEIVKAPGTVVVTAYAPCIDITKVLTPDIKGSKRKLETRLLWVRPTMQLHARLGGSALAQAYAELGVETPDFTDGDAKLFIKAFDIIQSLIMDGELLAGHDVSEGGVVTCLAEMAFAGCCGLDLLLSSLSGKQSEYSSPDEVDADLATLFAEEIGWVFEVQYEKVEEIKKKFAGIPCFEIGGPTIAPADRNRFVIRGGPDKKVWIKMEMTKMRQAWEQTSLQLELYQTQKSYALEEYQSLIHEKTIDTYKIKFNYRPRLAVEEMRQAAALGANTPRVAVLREEGTNGDREMAAAFMMAGFAVYDLTTTDLMKGYGNIHQFRGLAFPGGFSFADVLGAGVGWSACLKGSNRAQCALDNWRANPRNFSLAVCNGCQLAALLGWQNLDSGIMQESYLPDHRFKTNLSGRFESRWSRVKIEKTRNLLLKDMEGSVLGVWSAHKEGRFECREPEKIENYFSQQLVAISYVDDQDQPTESYPMNPNGSQRGIAGVSSECGRHLALMPHPERCVLPWQWPYKGHFPEKTQVSGPAGDTGCTDTAPWAKIFQNAYDWCINPEAFDVPGVHEMMQARLSVS